MYKYLLNKRGKQPLSTSPQEDVMTVQGIRFWQIKDREIVRLPKLTQILVYDTINDKLHICHPSTQRCQRFINFNKVTGSECYVFLLHKEPQFL